MIFFGGERYWIGKLQQVLNASDFRFGSYPSMDDQTIVSARKPLDVVIDWVCRVVSLKHDWSPKGPSSIVNGILFIRSVIKWYITFNLKFYLQPSDGS